jgi:hypothetical protein
MYIGSYSAEHPTIERLHAFLATQGYRNREKHHETYMSDPRRSAPEKLKTIIRQPVTTNYVPQTVPDSFHLKKD